MPRRHTVAMEWRGDEVAKNVMLATELAMRETLQEAVDIAKEFAPYKTGALRDDIQSEDPRLVGGIWIAEWGNFTVTYALWQNLGWRGHPGRYYLQQAQDIAMPKLAGRIAEYL